MTSAAKILAQAPWSPPSEAIKRCLAALAEPAPDGTREPVCAFLNDLAALRKHVSAMLAGLPQPCRLYYAVKANPDRRLIATLAPLVAGFEAASIGEIRRIREVSDSASVIFGGPGKKDAELEEALALGVERIHVESLHELRRLNLIAERRGRVVSILLRVNLHDTLPEATVTMAGRATQFGIDESQVEEAIEEARRSPALRLDGFHMHSISNNLDARLHARLVATYLARVRGWAERFDLEIRCVDAGGGFGVSYDERTDFDWADFVDAMRTLLAGDPLPGAELLFEPGRYIAAFCGYYAAEVIDLKQSHGRHFAILRGGTHHFRLPASWQHDHPFEVLPCQLWPYPFPRPELNAQRVTLAGELCTPKDVLASDVPVARLRIGDVVLFHRAGAYGWTISHHDFLGHAHPRHLYLDDCHDDKELVR
ncbi:type III PLP-dependent enzyme [Billgrantia diversa]|uniref:type III PLP-dependent enzyme n=1 Tax=Halomonas sp. MCCC 1A13316 TaxID=2733487 RepID=UPI0018A68E4D|nr:type III PLP-dependent enzyme [Halomonas sp. MCCC 1A13316]QOR38449.1 type III PLP-dependent enzyme [Halomonas sp. MCCC 1A13316]